MRGFLSAQANKILTNTDSTIEEPNTRSPILKGSNIMNKTQRELLRSVELQEMAQAKLKRQAKALNEAKAKSLEAYVLAAISIGYELGLHSGQRAEPYNWGYRNYDALLRSVAGYLRKKGVERTKEARREAPERVMENAKRVASL